jgi:hypothetical protein
MNINPPLTDKEKEQIVDLKWIDAIRAEFPDFNEEDICWDENEFKNLSFQERYIRMVRKYMED